MKKPKLIHRITVPKLRKDGSAVFSEFIARLEKAFKGKSTKSKPAPKVRSRSTKR